MIIRPEQLLENMFNAAIDAVSPQRFIPQHLENLPPVSGDTLVLCMGKAAGGMAQVVEQILTRTLGNGNFSGLVVTKHGQEATLEHLEQLTAGHPDPDAQSAYAAQRMLDAAAALSQNGKTQNRILVFISGGASALTFSPADGLTLADILRINTALLNGAVDITAMNTLRRELSNFNGGRLAVAAGMDTHVMTFAISDVPLDAPSVIGSGPTYPSPTGIADALDVITQFNLDVPQAVRNHLQKARNPSIPASHPTWHNKNNFTVMASSRHAVAAAASFAKAHNITPVIIDEPICGDAAQEAADFARIITTGRYNNAPLSKPCVLIRAGEPVVKGIPKDFSGNGGRASHAALRFLIDAPHATALFGATDGSDGRGGHMGVLLNPTNVKHNQTEAQDALARFASYDFFANRCALIQGRYTDTNVNDLWLAYYA